MKFVNKTIQKFNNKKCKILIYLIKFNNQIYNIKINLKNQTKHLIISMIYS